MRGIDFSRLRSLTAREIIQGLQRDGFILISQTGSHRQFHHPDGRKVTVSYHRSGQTYAMRTLRSVIERQARWTWDDLLRLDLV